MGSATRLKELHLPKRADVVSLKRVFYKYASVKTPDENFMTYDDFIRKYLGLHTEENYHPEIVELLAGAVDQTKDKLISFDEFQAFEELLCRPDSLFMLAHQLFDTNGSGSVSFSEFKTLFSLTEVHRQIPFDFNSRYVKMHFGEKRNKELSYAEFTQFLQNLQEEHMTQAFQNYDKKNTGSINSLQFKHIMSTVRKHLLTPLIEEKLMLVPLLSHLTYYGASIHTIQVGGETKHLVSYPFINAFNSLLMNIELMKKILTILTKGDMKIVVTKEEFLDASQKFTQVTPLEVDILFHLSDLLSEEGGKRGRLSYTDLNKISPDNTYSVPALYEQQPEAPHVERSTLLGVLEQLYRFSLGGIAGATGATAVYPIDLVKTRLQNQRGGSYIGEVMYKNSFDCFKKVIRHEGFRGLYRGLSAQLVGVAPEKAIKLTMNDFVRDLTSEPDGSISIWAEMLSGGCAGASQVMFTNPLEIVKIRLQVAGEITTGPKIKVIPVIRDLGFTGLYKGARACLMRDIPFSAIYFTAYCHLKKFFADKDGYNNPLSLFISATLSGMPAASLTTPFDVIKTRLQVIPREGQTTYNGVIDCAKKIWKQEGGKAFWKGAPARVVRSSPQFGVTLLTYEILQRVFRVDFGGRRPTGSEVKQMIAHPVSLPPTNPDHIGGMKLAVPTFAGVQTKFGISLPKFKTTIIEVKHK